MIVPAESSQLHQPTALQFAPVARRLQDVGACFQETRAFSTPPLTVKGMLSSDSYMSAHLCERALGAPLEANSTLYTRHK